MALIIIAAAGALLIATGVAFVYWPAALIVAGIELVAAAYIARYMEVRQHEASRTSR